MWDSFKVRENDRRDKKKEELLSISKIRYITAFWPLMHSIPQPPFNIWWIKFLKISWEGTFQYFNWWYLSFYSLCPTYIWGKKIIKHINWFFLFKISFYSFNMPQIFHRQRLIGPKAFVIPESHDFLLCTKSGH